MFCKCSFYNELIIIFRIESCM